MPLLFIRHSEDDSDYPKYSHDLPITKDGIKMTKKLTQKLINKHGVPDVIYCSPFKRCRSTVEIMIRTINTCVPIKIDTRLSKYYTESQQQNPNARPETQKYNPPTIETKEDVSRRSKNILTELRKTDLNVWCITHAIVVNNICKLIGNSNRYIEFLQVVKVVD